MNERVRLDHNDDYGIYRCWNKMTELLGENEALTVSLVLELDREQMIYLSEVFDDLSFRLKLKDFIAALRRRSKELGLQSLQNDIDHAEDVLSWDAI